MEKEGQSYIMNAVKIKKNLKDAIFPNACFPELAFVKKVYEGSGKGKYCVDVEILTPGSLEKTGELMSEVPLNPIFIGKKKTGLYVPPPADAVVIVAFIRGNRAFPYISGVYGNTYESADFKKDEFLLTDGDKIEIRISEGKITTINDKVEAIIESSKLSCKVKDVLIEADGDADTCKVSNQAGCKFEIAGSIKLNDVEILK